MSDLDSMKATKRKKYSYERDQERNAGKSRKYSYQKDAEYAAKHPRKKYSYERDLERAAKKGFKKHALIWILVVLFLALGAVGGFFGIKYAFKNDTFEMLAYANGEIDIVIGPDEEVKQYTELGTKCVSFGKDESSKCVVTYYYREDLSQEQTQVDSVDINKAGMYYAVYTTSATRYKSVTLIRNIYVVGAEDNG